MVKININHSFSNEDFELLENMEKRNFDSGKLLKLKFKAEEISNEKEIRELISYNQIKKNLAYKLPYQTDGALEILRDFNGSVLLADEVGLGKTITSGLVLKECVVRRFAKKILVLAPPSLVTQWYYELKDKFELKFKIIEKESDWENSDYCLASIDRVKVFDKKKAEFKHKKALNISWDMV